MIEIYDEKENVQTNINIPRINKVTDDDMNQLRTAVINGVYTSDGNIITDQNGTTLNPKIERYEGSKGKTLWENQNPTTNFNAQNITLNSSDYDYLEIFYYDETSRQYCVSVRGLKGDKILLHCNWSGSTNLTLMRMFDYVNDTTYSVSVGYRGGQQDNSICIPIKILGYKS